MFRPDDTPARLPDFRNIGVIARALVGVNLGLMFYLLLTVPDLANSLSNADRLAERMTVPRNRHEKEMTSLAGTLDSYYHSDEFQLRVLNETERIKSEVFGDKASGYYADKGVPATHFNAVAELRPASLYDFDRRLDAIGTFAQLPEAEALAAASKRIRNILRKAEGEVPGQVDEALLSEPAELALAMAMQSSARMPRSMRQMKSFWRPFMRIFGASLSSFRIMPHSLFFGGGPGCPGPPLADVATS